MRARAEEPQPEAAPPNLPKPVQNAVPAPKYKKFGPERVNVAPNEERGATLPTGIDYLAGGLPTFSRVGVPLTQVDYLRMEQCFPTAHSVENKGTELAALDVRVWGKSAEANAQDDNKDANDNGNDGALSDDGNENDNADPTGRGTVGIGGIRNSATFPAQDPKPNTQNPAANPGLPQNLAPAVAPKAALSKRAQKLQEIFDHSLGMDVFLSRAPWSYVRAIMFWQIQLFYVENVGICFDLTEGERNHPKCGGRIRLHPDKDSLVQIRGFNPWAPEELQVMARFDRKGWMVLKPLGGSSPDGDEGIAVQFSQDAKLYEKEQYNLGLHIDRYGVPISVLRDLTERQVRPTKAGTKPTQNANALRDLKAGGAIDVGLRILEHSEVKGDAAKVLFEVETRIEGRCDRRLNGTALLSDTRATGPTGSSNQARTTKNMRSVAGARYFQDVLSRELLPYIIEQNDIWLPGNIPPLADGELPPYVVLTEHGQREEDPTMARDPAGPAKPPDKRPLPSGEATKDKTEVPESK